MEEEISKKAYVPVMAYFDEYGHITPVFLTMEDGRTYEIDQVTAVSPSASLHAGGVRYTCMIQGAEQYVWLEEKRWFVEAAKE